MFIIQPFEGSKKRMCTMKKFYSKFNAGLSNFAFGIFLTKIFIVKNVNRN